MELSGLRSAIRLALATSVLALMGGGAWPTLAHEGHGGVQPVVREVRVGAERWRVGLGVVPADPVAGEELHIEVKAAALAGDGGMPERPASADRVRLFVDGTNIGLRPAQTPGVLTGVYRADAVRQHQLTVEVDTDGVTIRETFRVAVQPGPVQRLRPFVMAAFLLLSGMGVAWMWRRRRSLAIPGTRPPVAWIAGAGLSVVAVGVLSSVAVAPILAKHLLPDRQPLAVDWISDTPTVIAGSPGAFGEGEAMPLRPPTGTFEGIAVIPGRVVAAPDRVADVMVPMAGRVLVLGDDHISVARPVAEGQRLVVLQPTYVMHDALHLNNLRRPILQNMLAAKRRMLEAEAAAARLKLARAEGLVSLNELQTADAAAATAKAEFERWNRELALHDVQIADDQPTRVELTAPISGEIAVANFTQGQLVYEGDLLFTIVDLTGVLVEARVPERWVSRVGDRTIEFLAPAYPSLTFTGRLKRVAGQVDPETRTLSHFYAVNNPRKLLRIGMLVSARVPADAIRAASTSTQ